MTVSILIPAYNAAPFIARCLNSVLHQTHTELQVVIVDDGSTDNTLAVCKEHADKDNRIEIYHQENQGVAATRNHLLKKAKGDYVLFVDADDWIELDMVEYLLSLAIERDADFIMCDRVINDDKPSTAEPNVFELDQEHAIVDFLHHSYFIGSLCNKLLKHSLIQDERFYTNISYGEDALFCWDVLQQSHKVVVSNKQLYHYYMNEESISHQSFGEKKLTGHQTWTIISEDVKKRWPQYVDIVLATFAMNDMYLLQAAAQSGYPKNENIKMLQQSVRSKHNYLKTVRKSDLKRWLYATAIMYWYGFGRLYLKLYSLKNNKAILL